MACKQLAEFGDNFKDCLHKPTFLEDAPGQPKVSTPTVPADSSDESSEEVSLLPDQPDENEAEIKEKRGFWVSQSARQGFRRLHRFGGCWIQPGAKDTILEHLDEIVFDMRCKLCYPEDRTSRKEASASSSSSSSMGDSSSDEAL